MPIVLKVPWSKERKTDDVVEILFNNFKEATSKLGDKAIARDFLITFYNIPTTSEYIKKLKPRIETHLEEKGISLLTLLTEEDVQENDSEIDSYLSSERQGALLSGYPYIQGLEFNTVLGIVDESEGEREVQEVPILCSFNNMALRGKVNLAMILMKKHMNFDLDLD